MPFVQDTFRGGLLPMREHDKTIKPELKAVRHGVEIQVQEEDTGTYETKNSGDLAGAVFWKQDDSVSGSTSIGGGSQVQGDPPIQRKVAVSDYQKSGLPFHAQDVDAARPIGSWAQCVPSATTDGGDKLKPIFSKEGGVDLEYAEKTVKLEDFSADDHSQVRPAHGAPIPGGMPVLVAQCLNQHSHQHIAFPTGAMLAVDHKSTKGTSTRVVDVQENGFIDVSGNEAAALDSIFRVEKDEGERKIVALNGTKAGKDDVGGGAIVLKNEGDNETLAYLSFEKDGPFIGPTQNDPHARGTVNGKVVGPVHIDTNALFRKVNTLQDGPLRFSELAFPTIGSQSEEEFVEVELSFDPATSRFRWWAPLEQTSATAFARIQWNFDDTDQSQGELVDPVSLAPTGVKVFIDYEQSLGCAFQTAGDGAIFTVRRIAEEFVRGGETRQLFFATSVRKDKGRRISHFKMEDRNNFAMSLLSDDQPTKPWLDELAGKITTTIAGSAQPNIIRVSLPKQWSNSGGNYNFLAKSEHGRGLDAIGTPIRPQPKDSGFLTNKQMVSGELTGESPIAEYVLS